MAVDLNRIIQAAAEAALDDQASPRSRQQDGNQHKRKGLTAPRALLVGAGLATVARAATQKKLLRKKKLLRIAKYGVEKLVDVPNLRDLSDAVRDRLADHGLLDEDEDDRYEPDDAWDERDDDEDEDYGDDEPRDHDDEPPENEAEEDWDEEDEEDDEPRGEEPDDPKDEEDDEPWDEEDGEPRGEEPDDPKDEEDDEPWDEEDDGPSGEADGEPEAEGDWDDTADEGDQEPEAPGIELGSENGDVARRASRGFEAASQSGRGRGEAPELMQILGTPHSPPPALRGARRRDPLKRPPQPAPRSRKEERAGDPRRARSSTSHSHSNPKKPAGRKQKTGRD